MYLIEQELMPIGGFRNARLSRDEFVEMHPAELDGTYRYCLCPFDPSTLVRPTPS
ncbi:hypothetical protein OIDMADRAFT_18173 [Oidiodendron maius Zn]|uniref:Uncharacterized protein n=1 Tax=Oidiodendron maius (strain Zn) TaxID=913774 RepID=A0A0C3DPU4_OIDMZ|nr:hypothetical protein OIDMADRAFT_18173 [Oidiodendron maius Zn]